MNYISYEDIVNLFDNIPYNYNKITQEELDLKNGRNTNIFPYKGQFSPDLIKGLLKHYSKKNDKIFDPFMGCGTTLFEAAKYGASSFGTEINPAAYDMAKTTIFINLPIDERKKIVQKNLEIIDKKPLFTGIDVLDNQDIHKYLIDLLLTYKNDLYSYNLFANSYIRFLNNKKHSNLSDYLKAFNQHAQIVESLPFSKAKYEVFLNDSRNIPLKNNFIDLIITSPPYVNVFNYHQHNRTFIDHLYGNALHVAKSEFGANRKFRQNRFLTVTQYVLDMIEAYIEFKRVLKPRGRIIIIVGKNTKVRGISFRNDHIITGVGYLAGYKLLEKQERKFTNQFGEIIYEELLHFEPDGKTDYQVEAGRHFAKSILKASMAKATKEDVQKDLDTAIKKTAIITSSALYR